MAEAKTLLDFNKYLCQRLCQSENIHIAPLLSSYLDGALYNFLNEVHSSCSAKRVWKHLWKLRKSSTWNRLDLLSVCTVQGLEGAPWSSGINAANGANQSFILLKKNRRIVQMAYIRSVMF